MIINATNVVLLTLGLFDPKEGDRTCIAQTGVFKSTCQDMEYMTEVIAEYGVIRESESLELQLGIFPLDDTEPVHLFLNQLPVSESSQVVCVE